MDRRTFLKVAGATAAAASITPFGSAFAGAPSKVGLGLYTVRTEMAKSVSETLMAIGALGYGEVEFAGYYGHSAKEIKPMLADAGLSTPSAHLPLDVFENSFDAAMDFAEELGQRYLILPWLQQHDRTLDKYKAIFDLLNVTGEKAKARGMTVAYHNHEFEFFNVDGEQPYELLLERTDPSLVKLQLDLYWLNVAGVDPLSLVERFPGRVPLVHVKDRNASGDMVDVGAGTVDFARMFKASQKAGLQHYMVEHDNPVQPFSTIEASIQYLKSTFPRFAV